MKKTLLFIVVVLCSCIVLADVNSTFFINITNTSSCPQSISSWSAWSSCILSKQSRQRTCYNCGNVCGNNTLIYGNQSCTMPSSGGSTGSGHHSSNACTSRWACTELGPCVNGARRRSCDDVNDCVDGNISQTVNCELPPVVNLTVPVIVPEQELVCEPEIRVVNNTVIEYLPAPIPKSWFARLEDWAVNYINYNETEEEPVVESSNTSLVQKFKDDPSLFIPLVLIFFILLMLGLGLWLGRKKEKVGKKRDEEFDKFLKEEGLLQSKPIVEKPLNTTKLSYSDSSIEAVTKRNLEKGYTKEQIIESYKRNGISDEQIMKAFQNVGK